MTTFEHPVPTTTVHQQRIRLFQPTRRPILLRNAVAETAFGKITLINAKIGQAHADVLESIMFCAERKGQTADQRIKLLVDPFQVQKRAGLSSRKQLDQLLTELLAAVVQFEIPAKNCRHTGHLIDHVVEATKQNGEAVLRRNPLGGNRPVWRVELGRALTELIDADIWVSYDPARISSMRHGISQAVARHVLTHHRQPTGGWFIDTLVDAVAGQLSDQQIRDRRRELHADADRLGQLGILVTGNRIQKIKGVEQTPDAVEQTLDAVEQTLGAWSKPSGEAVFSDYPERRLDAAAVKKSKEHRAPRGGGRKHEL